MSNQGSTRKVQNSKKAWWTDYLASAGSPYNSTRLEPCKGGAPWQLSEAYLKHIWNMYENYLKLYEQKRLQVYGKSIEQFENSLISIWNTYGKSMSKYMKNIWTVIAMSLKHIWNNSEKSACIFEKTMNISDKSLNNVWQSLKTLRTASETYLKNIWQISETHLQHIGKISETRWTISEISLTNLWNISENSLKILWTISDKSRKCSKTSLNNLWKISE